MLSRPAESKAERARPAIEVPRDLFCYKRIVAGQTKGLEPRRRSRKLCFGLGLVVVVLGLGTRSGHGAVPAFVASYGGDTLWAVCAYLAVCFVAPQWSACRVAVTAGLVALLVETSQLYKGPWIVALRETLPGRLVLGQGFLPSDLVCYAVGVIVAYAFDRWIWRRGADEV